MKKGDRGRLGVAHEEVRCHLRYIEDHIKRESNDPIMIPWFITLESVEESRRRLCAIFEELAKRRTNLADPDVDLMFLQPYICFLIVKGVPFKMGEKSPFLMVRTATGS